MSVFLNVFLYSEFKNMKFNPTFLSESLQRRQQLTMPLFLILVTNWSGAWP